MPKTPHTTAQMVNIRSLCFILALATAACSSPQVAPAPVPSPTSVGWTGVHSPHTDFITNWASTWPQQAKDYATLTAQPLKLRCFTTDDAPFYVGLEQVMVINAPLEAVAATLDDIAAYKDLFPDLDKVEVRGRHKDQILTFWEVHIPIFFVPNIKYEMIYWVRDVASTAKVYRYQLRERDEIHASDGAIALLRQGPQTTLYVEYDFTDADWGAIATLAPGRIWSDTVKGIALSDLAVKAKSENPSLAPTAARAEAAEGIKTFDAALAACIKERQPFTPIRN